ncbi:MAG: orotate phosphoribosyltransferase [candidate division KSB1 bacterium]|nr:orotate phosphoribosyltransferase [candidate division KSB1 bacterium]
MDREEALDIFRKTGALLEGHFLLTSGLHSPQYFQCALVLQYPWYAELFCREIANRFAAAKVEAVIAPAMGGIVVSQEVGRLLGVRAMWAERETDRMALRRGFSIRPGERVLVVEDVVTTGGSVHEVIEVVRGSGGEVVGVGAIVDRSSGRASFGVPFAAAFAMDVVTYNPADCPLCRQGIPLVKPGSRKSLQVP